MPIFFLLLSVIINIYAATDKPVTRTMADKDLKWGPCPEFFPKGCEIGVLHGKPSEEQTDVYFKVPSDYAIPAHTHTSAEHMTLVSGTLDVKYKGEKPFTLRPGAYAYGPAELAHEAKCRGPEACVLFISFDEPIDAKAYKGRL